MLTAAYGAGRNSTAMLIEMANRGIRPEVITFADTGGEKPSTYAYMGRFEKWLVAHGLPGITRVKANRKDETLEAECLRKKILPSLAYGFKKCSFGWKITPQDQHFKGQNGKIRRAIGYHAGEGRGSKIKSDDRFEYWYPLKEWGIYQEDCESIIQAAGLCIPEKSACFFCPASRKAEVIDLAERSPDLFARAVAMERNAENLITVKGLGRHWTWEALVKAHRAQLTLFDFPDVIEQPCGCFDGDD